MRLFWGTFTDDCYIWYNVTKLEYKKWIIIFVDFIDVELRLITHIVKTHKKKKIIIK